MDGGNGMDSRMPLLNNDVDQDGMGGDGGFGSGNPTYEQGAASRSFRGGSRMGRRSARSVSPSSSSSSVWSKWGSYVLMGVIMFCVSFLVQMTIQGWIQMRQVRTGSDRVQGHDNGTSGTFLQEYGGETDFGWDSVMSFPNRIPIPVKPYFETKSGFLTVHVGKAGPYRGILFVEILESMLDEVFIINALYSRGDAQTSLLHASAEGVSRNWFAFRRSDSQPDTFLELYHPELEVRLTEEISELRTAWTEGVFPAAIASFRYIKNPRTGGLLFDASSWLHNRFFLVPFSDPSDTKMVQAHAFPQNVRIECDVRISRLERLEREGIRDYDWSMTRVEYSIVQLPKVPMTSRPGDSRVGFFTFSFFSLDHPDVSNPINDLIFRWRLEKLDPSKDQDYVKKPITFYIDPSIPERYHKFIQEGVERWLPAFADIGFLNAIQAKLPTDPDWPADYSAGDVRYPSISWSPSLNSVVAIGPSHVDPRSGEILHANIIFTHSWVRAWLGEVYVHSDSSPTQRKSPTPPEVQSKQLIHRKMVTLEEERALDWTTAKILARGLQLDDSVDLNFVGAGLAVTVSHEVGHALGLRHNFRASASVPFEKLTDADYVARNGFSTSVMDYIHPVFFPPETGQTFHFSPAIGPYDKHAIRYGYAPVTDSAELRKIAQEGIEKGLHFSTDEDDPTPTGSDPFSSMWDLSDDPLSYFELEIKNVKHMLPILFSRAVSSGEDWTHFTHDIIRLLQSAARSLEFASKFVGGVSVIRTRGLEAPRKEIPLKDQQRALELILREFDVKHGLFGAQLVAEYGKHFVVPSGLCGEGITFCEGEKALDLVALLRSLRSGALHQLVDLRKLHRIQSNFVLSEAEKDSENPRTGLSPVLRKISEAFLDGGLDAEVVFLAEDLFSQWLFLLKRALDMSIQSTGLYLSPNPSVFGTPVPHPVDFGTVRILLVGEMKRLETRLERLRQSSGPNGTYHFTEEFLQGSLSAIQHMTS
uniref:EcxA zinc-binding domain-containing protein n=1 Tax=Compsopogon caeruleus TaxID=31354 RepID=A0A6T6CMA4_9RHOD